MKRTGYELAFSFEVPSDQVERFTELADQLNEREAKKEAREAWMIYDHLYGLDTKSPPTKGATPMKEYRIITQKKLKELDAFVSHLNSWAETGWQLTGPVQVVTNADPVVVFVATLEREVMPDSGATS